MSGGRQLYLLALMDPTPVRLVEEGRYSAHRRRWSCSEGMWQEEQSDAERIQTMCNTMRISSEGVAADGDRCYQSQGKVSLAALLWVQLVPR